MTEERNYVVHPLFIILTLVLASVTALFIGFSSAYIYSRIQGDLTPVEIPVLFYTNSLFLFATSYLLVITHRAYEADNTIKYKRLLWIILGFTFCFLILQIVAWRQMLSVNIGINDSTLGAYLYVISGVHFVHVIAGIPFLVFFIQDAEKRLVEPISVLIYLSDPAKKRKLRALSIYWHYLDFLWVYLVVFFLVNKLI